MTPTQGNAARQTTSGHDSYSRFRQAIQSITPIWDTAQEIASLKSGFDVSGCSYQEAVTIDLLNAVADIGEAVHDEGLMGKANPAACAAFMILQECCPETLLEPVETLPNLPPELASEQGTGLSHLLRGVSSYKTQNQSFDFGSLRPF